MASSQEHDDAASERRTSSPAPADMSIRIISPSTEVPSPLVLTSIQRSTTVAELKLRIQDAVPSKPSVDRQRLIHRGRMLGDANEAMSSVFGQGTLDETPLQVLHLVIRPESGLMPPSMAQSRSEPGRTNANSDDRPASVPPPATHHLPGHQQALADAHAFVPVNPHLQPPLPFPQGLPPHLQHLIQQHQMAGLGPLHALPFPQHTMPIERRPGTHARVPPTSSDDEANPPTGAQARRMFQQHVNQHQRARAAAGRHGGGGHAGIPPAQARLEGTYRNAGDAMVTRRNHPLGEHRHRDAPAPGVATMHARQTQVPHGSRWQVTVNETTMEFPAAMYYPGTHGSNPPNGHGGVPNATPGSIAGVPLPPGVHPGQHMQIPPSFPPPGLSGRAPTPRGRVATNNAGPPNEQRRAQGELLRHHLSYMETLARRDQAPSPHLLSEASAALHAMLSDLDHQPQESTPTGSREGHGHGRHGRGRSNLEMYSSTAHPTPRPSSSGGEAAPGTAESSFAPIYLLSSPTGHYGLVSTPVGLYTTNPSGAMQPMLAAHPFTNQTAGLQGFAMPQVLQHAFPDLLMHGLQVPGALPYGSIPQPAHPTTASAPAAQAPVHPQPHHQPPAQAQPPQDAPPQPPQQAQDENQVRELLRLLLPLGGHLWLLVRLLGFLLFFTGGSHWRRTVIIAILTALYFLAQGGYLTGVRNALWAPVQRHLEGILPLADAQPGRRGGDRPLAAGAGAGAGAAAAGGAAGAEGRNADDNNINHNNNPGAATTVDAQAIDPALAAARLLRDREERRRGWFIEQLRGIERALVIFLASLVPGVGERHIAARDAAAAAAARDALVAGGAGGGSGGDTAAAAQPEGQRTEGGETPQQQAETGQGTGQAVDEPTPTSTSTSNTSNNHEAVQDGGGDAAAAARNGNGHGNENESGDGTGNQEGNQAAMEPNGD